MALLALAFTGKQNSGKTTLLEKLIAELTRRGYNVGTLKHHGHAGFDFDIEGKDSWRHAQAGSRFTVVSAPDKIALVRELDAPEDADNTLAAMVALSAAGEAQGTRPLDIILVEGYRHSGLPTVELFRAANPRDAERELGGEGNTIIAVVTDLPRIEVEAAARGIPSFGFEDTAALASFVEKLMG
ncbi:MAG: molybdopterin-guanine dinucleotide biosynthesis protein B [Coriobacteriales bacterium]|jgi:molybdopterin-guanine dinucleotide biosynthesis protein MobB|nr:molybdopterin-guanine dinucleotide biosynthesis protein B [Coriobacteriales bacterium]